MSIPWPVAKSAVPWIVSTSSVSAPSTNIPWMWRPWSLTFLIQEMISSRSLFFIICFQRPGIDGFKADVQSMAARVSHQAEKFRVPGNIRPHLGRPSHLNSLRNHSPEDFLCLLLSAVKLSSTMNLVALDTDATYFNSFSVASTDLKRYFLPNIWMTEQNLQSKGQPLDVETG